MAKIIPFEQVSYIEPNDIDGFFRVHFITELEQKNKTFVGASVLYMGAGTGHKKHVHDSTYEIAYVLHGEAEQSFWDEADRKRTVVMHAGTFAAIPPQKVHQTMSLMNDADPLVMYIFTAYCVPRCEKVTLKPGETQPIQIKDECCGFVLDGSGSVEVETCSGSIQDALTRYTQIDLSEGENCIITNSSDGMMNLLWFSKAENDHSGGRELFPINVEDSKEI